MMLRAKLTVRSVDIAEVQANQKLLYSSGVVLHQELDSSCQENTQFYVLLFEAQSLPRDIIGYINEQYSIRTCNSWRIFTNRESNGDCSSNSSSMQTWIEHAILLELPCYSDMKKIYSIFHDQWLCPIAGDAESSREKMDLGAPVFAIAVTTVVFESLHAKGRPEIEKYNGNYQRIPSCAVCLRRLKRCQNYSSFCVARSFVSSDNFQCSCRVCGVLHFAQSASVTLQPQSLHCTACQLQQNLWICLTCGYIGCGRYSQQHAQQHAHTAEYVLPDGVSEDSNAISLSLENHSWALELATGRIWDYSLDDFAHYENEQQLLLPVVANTSLPSPQQLRAVSFSEAHAQLQCIHGLTTIGTATSIPYGGSKILLISNSGSSVSSSFHTSSSGAEAAMRSLEGHVSTEVESSSSSVSAMKLDRIAAEYERLMEQQLQEQQMHFDKLIARETVRALQAQCVAATHHHSSHATPLASSKHHPSGSNSILSPSINVESLNEEEVDEVLREIEQLKIHVSAAEVEQEGLLTLFKAQDEATREAKKQCDQLLRRQKQLRHLEESLKQREIDTKKNFSIEIDELKQQIRDLSFYLETQSNKEINGGSFIVAENTFTSNSTPIHLNKQKSNSTGKRK